MTSSRSVQQITCNPLDGFCVASESVLSFPQICVSTLHLFHMVANLLEKTLQVVTKYSVIDFMSQLLYNFQMHGICMNPYVHVQCEYSLGYLQLLFSHYTPYNILIYGSSSYSLF
jgi:hypothetical protein